MKYFKYVFFLLVFNVANCGIALTQSGSNVKFSKAEPGPECQLLGDFEGGGIWISRQGAKNDFLNKIAESGGNYGIVDTYVVRSGGNWLVIGRGYKCPTQ